ncbi:hypothetical protein EJB05_55190, partial [Eragrostis curvula]
MGCSSSRKLEEEEAVRTCHDRKSFVKKAIAQRSLLASSHVAYVQSLRRVSLALFYFFAEDEHLYFLQESAAAALVHRPASPDRLFVVNCLRPGGAAPVHPLEQWEPEAAETAAVVDRFFGLDHQFFQPSPIDSANDVPVSPQMTRWDDFWDPFSSLTDHHHRYENYGVQEVKAGQEDEQMPELEEESSDEDDSSDGEKEEAEEKAEQMKPRREEEKETKVDHVNNELRVLASADVEQHGTPGFTVYVDRPPTSLAEAMKDIQEHFAKIVETGRQFNHLPRRTTAMSKARSSRSRRSHSSFSRARRRGLDRPLRVGEEAVRGEVRAGEKVRLAYEKKVRAAEEPGTTMAPSRSPSRRRGPPSGTSVPSWTSPSRPSTPCSRRIAARARRRAPAAAHAARPRVSWRGCGGDHRSAPGNEAHGRRRRARCCRPPPPPPRPDTDSTEVLRGPPPPPGPTRASSAAGALASELRSWRAAQEAWASRSAGTRRRSGAGRGAASRTARTTCRASSWAGRAPWSSVDVEAATRAVDAVAAEAAGVAAAAKRQRGAEEWFNEEEAKKKLCVGLAAALGAVTEAGGMAVVGYDELVLEIEAMERPRETAGRYDEAMQKLN